jgi:8-oxo-dGTP diphosphatase
MSMPETPRTTVGTIIIKDGKILLVKRGEGRPENRDRYPFKGFWCFPGGHVDLGETIEQAAVREVKEETGLEIKNPKFLFYVDEAFPEINFYAAIHVFVANYDGGEVKIQEGEVADFKWVTVDEGLKEKLAFENKKTLEMFKKKYSGEFL